MSADLILKNANVITMDPSCPAAELVAIKGNKILAVAGSSDCPVVPDNPLLGIYGAVTRRAESGEELSPEECISAEQALAMYTINAAYASFEEDIKGSITPGKLAGYGGAER